MDWETSNDALLEAQILLFPGMRAKAGEVGRVKPPKKKTPRRRRKAVSGGAKWRKGQVFTALYDSDIEDYKMTPVDGWYDGLGAAIFKKGRDFRLLHAASGMSAVETRTLRDAKELGDLIHIVAPGVMALADAKKVANTKELARTAGAYRRGGITAARRYAIKNAKGPIPEKYRELASDKPRPLLKGFVGQEQVQPGDMVTIARPHVSRDELVVDHRRADVDVVSVTPKTIKIQTPPRYGQRETQMFRWDGERYTRQKGREVLVHAGTTTDDLRGKKKEPSEKELLDVLLGKGHFYGMQARPYGGGGTVPRGAEEIVSFRDVYQPTKPVAARVPGTRYTVYSIIHTAEPLEREDTARYSLISLRLDQVNEMKKERLIDPYEQEV